MQYYISDYLPHPGQVKLHKSDSKEILVISSIRAGKSFSLQHEAIVSAWNNETPFGLLISAPTYKLVEAVLERPIVKQLEYLGLLAEHSFSRHETTLKNGNIIYYRSLEEPDNALRGLNIFKAIVDEASYCSKYSIDVVKGRLLTTNGQLILVGTPSGTTSWMYDEYIATPKDNVEYIKFSIFDNPIITEEAVERLRQSYDPLMFKQEVLGEWVNLFRNQVYYSFSEENIGDYPFNSHLPVYIGLDFNIDQNAWCAFQKRPDNTITMIYEGFGAKTTADLARQIIDKFGNQVIVIPDATGNNRIQGVAQTNFQLLRQAGLNRIVENRRNPDRLKRYAVVNAVLQNAKGQRRLFIDKSCINTIREFRELSYKTGSDKPDDKNNTAGHRTDAAGYGIVYLTADSVGQIINPNNDFMSGWKKQYAAFKNHQAA